MAWWQQLVIWEKVQRVLTLKLQFCKRRQRHSVKKGRQDSNTRWAIGDLFKFSPQEPFGFFPWPWAGTLGSDCPKHFPACWTQPMAPPAGILHTSLTTAPTQKHGQTKGEKAVKNRFCCYWNSWGWVFGSFAQVCAPPFGCKELMLVTLMDIGLGKLDKLGNWAVKLFWCLLQLNIGELELWSWVPFLWFYELYLKLQNLCKH